MAFWQYTMFRALIVWVLAAQVQGADVTLSAEDLRQGISAGVSQCGVMASLRSVDTRQTLLELYQHNAFAPLWDDPRQRAALRQQLLQLADDGLVPEEYSLALTAIPAAEVCAELRLSRSYLLALEHLSLGRLPPPAHEAPWLSEDALPVTLPSVIELALSGLQAPALAFDRARPDLPLYRDLRRAYSLLDKQAVDYPQFPDGATLKPGMEDSRVPLLVEHLQADGYLDASAAAPASPDSVPRYDEQMRLAVQRFQADHGLEADGLVGPKTMAALNLTVAQRLQQVRINLERLRWLAVRSSAYMLLVNIAGGNVWLYRDQQLVWQSRVMTGQPRRPTPLLVSRIDRITLNPSWTVPPTILREDKLPAIRRDPDFFRKNDLQVLDAQGNRLDPEQVDWLRPAGVLLRQPPGPANPLGQLVFRFANPFSVFLHDTPSQQLFAKAERNLSSGCIRVEDATGLAAHLFADTGAAPRDDLALPEAGARTREVSLPNGPQLIVGYWTAEADATGRLRLLQDPYGRDSTLMAAFARSDSARQAAVMAPAAPVC